MLRNVFGFTVKEHPRASEDEGLIFFHFFISPLFNQFSFTTAT
jgi:hypothetical protein